MQEQNSNKKWGLFIKCRCTIHLTTKDFLHAPYICELCMFITIHVNKDGCMVYRGMKVDNLSTFSAHLSPIINESIYSCLNKDYHVQQIMKKNLKFLHNQKAGDMVITRDMLLTLKDIRNISPMLARETYMLYAKRRSKCAYMGAKESRKCVLLYRDKLGKSCASQMPIEQ